MTTLFGNASRKNVPPQANYQAMNAAHLPQDHVVICGHCRFVLFKFFDRGGCAWRCRRQRRNTCFTQLLPG
ncbi:hypothetical protein DSM43518_00114 [Mycobacterium marinum]|nr:hypothetical protein DSM43518_00114 [Mycobacterium marinum]